MTVQGRLLSRLHGRVSMTLPRVFFMTHCLLLAGAVTLAVLAPSFVAAADVLRVGTDAAYPPFSFKAEDGTLQGFDVDIARALCEELGRECVFVVSEWSEIIDNLNDEKYDVIVASMAKTPEREEKVDFTQRYYRARSGYIGPVALKDLDVSSKQNMAGKRVGVMLDTVQHEYMQEHFGDVAQIVTAKEMGEVYELLENGQVDLVLADNLNHLDFLDDTEAHTYDFIGESLPAEHASSAAFIALRKGEDELRQKLNKALETLWLNGTYEQINQKYFPFSIY